MALRVYNTMSRKKEEFKPLVEGKVGIYVCGVTVYDLCHIGHARSAVVFDIIVRYLRYRGYDVTFVKNYTDVDDKIINRANKEGVGFADVSERYIREHDTDMGSLGILRPTVSPRATESIAGMIRLIQVLIARGLAYEVEGDVYYAVENFKDYGKLSGRNIDELRAGARVEVGEKKKNPLDFALWKASKEGEPWWESPWGKGRPGWHIECSVMSSAYLGETFDIHGGGEDLIFPHHENEIAQSEGATGKPFARYWVHNGFIRVDNEKMSKSLGNFFTIRDILKSYHPEVVRFFMLTSHYRSPLDYSEEALRDAKAGLERLYTALKGIKDRLSGAAAPPLSPDALSGRVKEVHEKVRDLPQRFVEAMDDDFNTARALGTIFEAARLLNAFMSEKGFKTTADAIFVLKAAEDRLGELGGVFGILQEDPDVFFGKSRAIEAQKRGLDIGQIEGLIAERSAARAAKDWKRADEKRAALSEMGVVLKDSSTGTEWSFGT
jgi:cysteinyl-tRNA synthetase